MIACSSTPLVLPPDSRINEPLGASPHHGAIITLGTLLTPTLRANSMCCLTVTAGLSRHACTSPRLSASLTAWILAASKYGLLPCGAGLPPSHRRDAPLVPLIEPGLPYGDDLQSIGLNRSTAAISGPDQEVKRAVLRLTVAFS